MSEDLRPHLRTDLVSPPTDRTFSNGGGGGTYPRKSYDQHSKRIFKEAQTVKEVFSKQIDAKQTSRRYFRVELPEEMNVWVGDGKVLETNIHGSIVGTPKKNIGHISTLSASFESLIDQLKTYSGKDNRGKSKFATLESIQEIPASEKISSNLSKILNSGEFKGEALITLFPDLTREESKAVQAAISEYLKKSHGEVLTAHDTDSGTVVRVKANAKPLEELASSFLSIQTVDAIEEVLVEASADGERIEDSVTVLPNNSSARVVIFDSGVVSNSRFLDSSIIARENPLGPPYSVMHGTFVASRIIYGNGLRDAISSQQLKPDVKVLSVCMISHTEIGNQRPARGEEFLRILRDTVARWHREIKVYNLSMNLVIQDTQTAAIVTDDHVGPVAAEIDKLSRNYGVLFIVTSGNIPIAAGIPPPSSPYPQYFQSDDSRLCRPAEAMLAITVGSISDRSNGGSMAPLNCPSPFTRRGPGFNGYRKPDVVSFGGNYAANWSRFEDLDVVGISKDGDSLAYGTGTSYAAPIVSRMAALLFARIPDATQELVRALIIHSTKLPDKALIDDEIFVHLVGNGLPSEDGIFTSDRWNQHYLFHGKIGYRKIAKIRFYVPRQILQRQTREKVRVRFTLVFSPETNRALKSGYCKSHLRTQLLKLNSSGDLVAASSDDTHETVRDKYSTVIRYDKTFSRGVSAGEWQLLIEQQTKWSISDPETPFAVVITVSDPKKEDTTDIFAAIQNEIPNRYQNAEFVPLQTRAKN